VPDLLSSTHVNADSLVIASEWFGNAGCHLSALNLLKRLPNVGFPLFTDGYSLAIARLAAYAPRRLGGRPSWRVESSATGAAAPFHAVAASVGKEWEYFPPEQQRPNEASPEQRRPNEASWQRYYSLIREASPTPVAWITGQNLMPWNCDDAGNVHRYLLRDIKTVDWSSYFLRISLARFSRPRALRTALDWLSTRLMREWTAITWRIPAERGTSAGSGDKERIG
jgi:hypothetical protein